MADESGDEHGESGEGGGNTRSKSQTHTDPTDGLSQRRGPGENPGHGESQGADVTDKSITFAGGQIREFAPAVYGRHSKANQAQEKQCNIFVHAYPPLINFDADRILTGTSLAAKKSLLYSWSSPRWTDIENGLPRLQSSPVCFDFVDDVGDYLRITVRHIEPLARILTEMIEEGRNVNHPWRALSILSFGDEVRFERAFTSSVQVVVTVEEHDVSWAMKLVVKCLRILLAGSLLYEQ